MSKPCYILGIDTSCDDTSFAVLDAENKKVLASVVSSQVKLHAEHGGIVPELASRSHMENLHVVFDEALRRAQMNIGQLSAIAVTRTPGLIGCLLVGTCFARALAYQLGVPLYGVNHLEGHLFSPFIESEAVFPFVGLVVSGGHTLFYHVKSFSEFKIIGQTVDDAAGEAFDKCAKMLGLGYPGGPLIDRHARSGNDRAFRFTVARVKMGPEYLSFSGLKTAAYHYISSFSSVSDKVLDDICASIQKGIVDNLCRKLEYFLDNYPARAFALSGGVAMNSLLRRRVLEVCQNKSLACILARPRYCTDNGAMIAHAALVQNLPDVLFSLETRPTKKIRARELKKYAKVHSRQAQKTFSESAEGPRHAG